MIAIHLLGQYSPLSIRPGTLRVKRLETWDTFTECCIRKEPSAPGFEHDVASVSVENRAPCVAPCTAPSSPLSFLGGRRRGAVGVLYLPSAVRVQGNHHWAHWRYVQLNAVPCDINLPAVLLLFQYVEFCLPGAFVFWYCFCLALAAQRFRVFTSLTTAGRR